MTCDLLVKAPLAVKNFEVEIISDMLTDEVLKNDVGLAAKFSLVEDEHFFTQLQNLRFPVGDEVAGKTELNLSITDFLSILGMLGPGQHDFVMTVTDTEGNVTSKIVMFEFL